MHMGPTLAVGASFDADGVLWVATVAKQHVELRRSADGGRTFAPPAIVNAAPEHILAAGESAPDVAIGSDGQIDVSWSRHDPATQRLEVRFARSLDGGRHFSPPVTINRDHSAGPHYFDALAVDGHGRVWVTWIDARDASRAKARHAPYRGFAIYAAHSDDGGATFSAGRKLVDHSCECCRLALARQPDGHVAALFRMVYPGDVRDHALLTLTATSHAAAARVTFNNWSINACPEHGPALAIGADGTRHAVWYEAKATPTIHYGQLRPGQPPHHALRVAGAGAAHARLAVTGQTVRIVWNQVDAAGWTLQTRVSTDGGVHFSPPRRVATSTEAAAEPVLVQHAGRVFAIWNTVSGLRVFALGDKA